MILYGSSARAASRADNLHPLDSPPANFDPVAHPILARHFFGVEPSQQTNYPAGRVFHEVDATRRGMEEFWEDLTEQRGVA